MTTLIGNYTISTAASSLLTDLIAFWKLDEASGTRADSVGNNDLSDNNTVTQVAGKIGNAAQFVATNNEFLSITDNADLSMGADVRFTFTFWAYHDTITAGIEGYISKDDVSSREYSLYCNNGTLSFDIWDPVDNMTTNGAFTISATAWVFICFWYNGANLSLSINNGTPTDFAYTADVKNAGASFEIGRHAQQVSRCMDGRIDAVGFWKRALTADERTALYNSGNGKEYPFS